MFEDFSETVKNKPLKVIRARKPRVQHVEYDGSVFGDESLTPGMAEIVRQRDIVELVRHIDSYSAANYIGNKREIAEQIVAVLDRHGIDFDSVFDAFSGSGTVSLLFALMGKTVVCNDLLTSSALQAECLLNIDPSIVTHKDWMFLIENRPDKTIRNSIREFCASIDTLLTDEEVVFLDNFRANLFQRFGNTFQVGMGMDSKNLLTLDGNAPSGDPDQRIALALYALIMHINSHCFVGGRYYKGQTLAKLEHRLNHQQNNGRQFFETFYDHTAHRVQFPSPLRNLKCRPVVYNLDIIKLLESKKVQTDLLYLDPPYGGEASDYVYKYRFIEEYLRGEKLPEATLSGGARFDKRKGFAEEFVSLLDLCGQFPTWLISFNASSFAKLNDIVEIISKFRSRIDVEDVAKLYKYRKERTVATDREFLILARKR